MGRIRALKESWDFDIYEVERDEELPEKPVFDELMLSGMVFTPKEYEKVKLGVVPGAMEDKWFIYWEDGKVYCHRSWGGECAFVVRFAVEEEGYSAVSVEALPDFVPCEQIPAAVGALLYYLAENPARQLEYTKQYEDLVLNEAEQENKDMGALVSYVMFGIQILRGLDGDYGE